MCLYLINKCLLCNNSNDKLDDVALSCMHACINTNDSDFIEFNWLNPLFKCTEAATL